MSNRNKTMIRCNPYTQTIKYYRFDSENGEYTPITAASSPFLKDEFTKVALHHKANEVLQEMNKTYNTGNVGLDILFEGTKEDMDYLTDINKKYFVDNKIDINIKPGDMHLKSAVQVKEEIEEIFAVMNKTFSEYADNDVTKYINRFSETVRPTIPICVMGLYSAGKSAFINSLIGVELLPSASDPTTAKTYKISTGQKYEIKFTYTDKYGKAYDVMLSFNDKEYKLNQNAELDIVAKLNDIINKYDSIEERMYNALSIINNYDMDYNRNLNEKDQLWRVSDLIEVTLPIKASVLPFDDFDFIIYDTPGSNSASNTDHTAVLRDALEGQTNGLPIFVTQPDNMDAKDNNELIGIIDKLGGALDKSNLMIIVNKADDKSSATLEQKKNNFKGLAVSNLNPAGTYFISSIAGLGFRKFLNNNIVTIEDFDDEGETIEIDKPRWLDSDSDSIFEKNKKDFKRKNNPKKLYEYNIIPQQQYDSYSALLADENKNINDTNEYAYRNSGLHAIETAIKNFAEKYALYNKCRMAGSYLSEALDKLKERITALTNEQKELSEKLNAKMTDQEKELLEKLSDKCEEKKEAYTEEFTVLLLNAAKENLADLEKNIVGVIDKFGEDKDTFAKKLNDYINNKIRNTYDHAKASSLEFWNKKQKEFKEELIKIVVDSPYLTEEQKNLLSDAIMEIEGTPNYSNLSEIRSKDVEGKFLFFRYVKSIKAKEESIKKFEKGCAATFGALTDESTKSFKELVGNIESKFKELINKHNPEMLKLQEQYEDCVSRKKNMEKQDTSIKDSLEDIKALTDFIYGGEEEE